mgnify:CR=1 FL=1
MPTKRGNALHRQAGVTLIEVLITALVLSIGLLGLAGLQAYSLQANDSAYLRSQAAVVSYALVDRLRAERANASSYDTGGSFIDENSNTGNAELDGWAQEQLARLPGGEARVDCDGAESLCTIEIRWDDTRAGGDSTQTFQTQTRP